MEQYTYQMEHYFVRKALTEKEQYRCRRGKRVDAEHALYLSVTRVMPTFPVCVVQLIHGIDEHTGRYIPFAKYLASRGIAVVMHDLRGHGDSLLPGKPEVPHGLGYPGENALELLHTDIDAVYASVYKDVPEDGHMDITAEDLPGIDPLPRYLLGFSMGALVAGHYLTAYDDNIAGALLAGLPHREPMISFALNWVRFLSLFLGEEEKPLLLGKYSFQRYNKPFLRAGESGSFLWLSEERENIATFCADPLCGAVNTISMYRFLLSLVQELYRPAFWEMTRRDLPIWLFSGEKDPVAGGEKWVLDSETFLSDIGYTHIDNRIFPNLRHEIFMDKNKEAVWQEAADCILGTVVAEQARLDTIREKEEAAYTSMFEGK